jgi:hypothetical protein
MTVQGRVYAFANFMKVCSGPFLLRCRDREIRHEGPFMPKRRDGEIRKEGRQPVIC